MVQRSAEGDGWMLWHPVKRRWWRGTVTRDWTLSVLEAALYTLPDAQSMRSRIDPHGRMELRVVQLSEVMARGVLNPMTEEE